jgi:hypothetical protein
MCGLNAWKPQFSAACVRIIIWGDWVVQDQIEFENRCSRRRGAPEPGLMPESDSTGEELDGAPTGEQLFSAGPTMMGAEARDMLLAGDKDQGLACYKRRMYRKMDADNDEKARLPLLFGSLKCSCHCSRASYTHAFPHSCIYTHMLGGFSEP